MGWILLLGWNHAFRTLSSRFIVSKSIPVAKSQNVVKISGAQKPSWAKCLKFNFFYLKRQGY